jgi:hypothetical protein
MSLTEPSHNLSTTQPEPHARKRPVSERKILANRKNALRSTGPKTERGKRAVSRNAITHGLLAREVVITAGDGEESLEEFHELVEQMWNCYQPVGVVEEMLVQIIVVTLWRKARAIRAENGEIRKRLDTVGMDLLLRNLDMGNLALVLSDANVNLYSPQNPADGRVSTMDRWSALQDIQSNMRGHRSSLLYLKQLLQVAKSEIEDRGYISENIRKRILLDFCFWDYPFALACRYAGPPAAKKDDGSSQSVDEESDDKHSDVAAFIDHRLSLISLLEEHTVEREKLQEAAETRSFSLPPADATDKLLRYEAHLDKQLYRAMGQLERLQRLRRGENVPPPLDINLSKRS